MLSSPLVLLGDNGSAGLNKIIVSEHQEVSEGCGACPCPYSSGYEILQGSFKSEGGKQVLLINLEAGYVVYMCDRRGGEDECE